MVILIVVASSTLGTECNQLSLTIIRFIPRSHLSVNYSRHNTQVGDSTNTDSANTVIVAHVVHDLNIIIII